MTRADHYWGPSLGTWKNGRFYLGTVKNNKFYRARKPCVEYRP